MNQFQFENVNDAAFIMAVREKYRFSQEEIGDALNVDKMTISRWERGINKMSSKSKLALSKLIIDISHIQCPHCKKRFII